MRRGTSPRAVGSVPASGLRALRDAPLVDYAGVAAPSSRCSSCCTRISASTISAPHAARARAFRDVPGARRRAAAAARAVRGAAGSTSMPPTPRHGAGRRGPRSIAIRSRPRWQAFAPSSSSASSTSSTCSGRRRSSSSAPRRAASARPRARPVPRPRGVGRSRRRGSLGQPGSLRLRRERRRAARRSSTSTAGLGPAAAASRAPANRGYELFIAHAARKHALCRRAAHRPRDGA